MSPFDHAETPLPEARAVPAQPRRPAIFLLVAMTGLGPFTMQILIPCLPAMAAALEVSYATVQLTLTLFLAGVAGSQLFYGPLADRFGRKPPLLVGLALFVIGSAAAAAAPNATWLIIARVVQAIGGCAGLVLGRAMIRDAWPREQAASVLGTVSTAMAMAPMVAPLLGSLLAEAFGWRATMLACLVIGLPLLALMWARLPETLPRGQGRPATIGGMLRGYGQLLRIAPFRGYVGVTAASTGVFFAFAAGGPQIVVEGMGYSPTTYALWLMLISLAWSGGTFTASRLSRRLGVLRMLALGSRVTVLGGVLALLSALFAPPVIMAFVVPMAVVALGNGMTQPNAIAGAVSVRPLLAGTASGLVGATQMAFGAVMTVLVGFTEHGAGTATALWMLAAALLTQAALVLARRPDRADQRAA